MRMNGLLAMYASVRGMNCQVLVLSRNGGRMGEGEKEERGKGKMGSSCTASAPGSIPSSNSELPYEGEK